jgi:hypothetical protein
MCSDSNKPIIFISYAHADEPEKPAEGEVRWLERTPINRYHIRKPRSNLRIPQV